MLSVGVVRDKAFSAGNRKLDNRALRNIYGDLNKSDSFMVKNEHPSIFSKL